LLTRLLNIYITEQEKSFGEFLTREEIIRIKLNSEEDLEASNERPTDNTQTSFFTPLRRAWDALAYERYEPGSEDEHMAGSTLCSYTGSINGGPTIKLTNPLQVKILDAITEVAGIPHKKGQSEIPIPDKLQHYHEWIFSQEYQELLAKAKAKR
jgi:hypothetical protein